MKKTLAAVIALAALPLIGCAGPKITAQDVALQKEQTASEERREVAKAQADKAEVDAIGSLDPIQQGMAFTSKMMRDVVVAVLEKDNKRPMGFYEMKERIAAMQNALVDKTTGRVLNASLIGGGIAAAHDLGKHAIDKAGDRTNIQGDGNSYAQERVTSNADTTTKNFGENGTATSGAPTVAGPDKSTNTTIEAPPEPELPEEPEGEFTPTEPPDFPDGPVEIPGPEAAE